VQAARLGRAAVREQRHREVAHERGPDRGLYTQVRDHAADDQLADAQATQQRLQRGPLERVEPHLVHHQVAGPAAELVHHLGVPVTIGQAVDPGQGGTGGGQRWPLVGAAGPVHVPGEDHRDRGPAGLGDGHRGIAYGAGGTVQAHADPRERAFRVAETVLHVHHEQRPVRHVHTSIAGQSLFTVTGQDLRWPACGNGRKSWRRAYRRPWGAGSPDHN
jgi:hypothetical protein